MIKKVALFILFISCLITFPSYSENKTDPDPSNEYTINYHNVAMVEYLRFVSKICEVNFLFNEADLQFPITVISEEPIDASNVMATFVQILRVHGLNLIEQEGNLLIHKSEEVKQAAKVVSTSKEMDSHTPLVTRIFRIRNAKPSSISALITPLLSKEALLEVLPETRQVILTDITANVKKMEELIDAVDSAPVPLESSIYHAKAHQPDYLSSLAQKIMVPLTEGTPFFLIPQDPTNSIFILSTPQLIDKASSILAQLDSSKMQKFFKPENIFIYKIQFRPEDEIRSSLLKISKNLKENGLIDSFFDEMIQSASWIQAANSFLFTGSKESIDKLKEILSFIDTSERGTADASFFLYKIQNVPVEQITESLTDLAENLKKSKVPEKDLIKTIESVKYIKQNNSLLFTGTEVSLNKLQKMLPSFDEGLSAHKVAAARIPSHNQFFVYKPEYLSSADLTIALKDTASNLEAAHLTDPPFLNTLKSYKWVESTHSFLFTGDDESIARLGELLKIIDSPQAPSVAKVNFFLYKPQFVSKEKIERYLTNLSNSLIKKPGASEDELIQALQSMKWIPESQSFMFSGTDNALTQIRELITNVDSAGGVPEAQSGYFLYKLQNMPGNVVQEDLDLFAQNLKAKGIENSPLLELIDNVKWIKETNTLMLTGTPAAIEEAKDLILKYDVPRKEQAFQGNFFIYKAQYVSALTIENQLKDIAVNLKKSGLADPNLLNAIHSIKYIESNDSLVFTGNSESLLRIQDLIGTIDVSSAQEALSFQHEGNTTFVVYKIKQAPAQQIISSLQAFEKDLKNAGTADKDLIDAIDSVKYRSDTNTLVFSGTESALTRVIGLVEKFDVLSGFKGEPPSAFYVYKPQNLSGPTLQMILIDFANHLRLSGLEDQNLFFTINSVKWIENTKSLVFTGTPKAIDELKNLLITFDVPSIEGEPFAPSIQPIEETSFLVYKLQYHKGNEIQAALKQVGVDLNPDTAAGKPSKMFKAINSVQWIQVTNSLLASGDQDTVTRLRELIRSLDIPLKQVFIEMLVINTTFNNLLDFGLDWGSKYQHKQKWATGIGNFSPASATSGTVDNVFQSGLGNTGFPTPPTTGALATNIPFTQGFDLGVIGDILMHKGQSFLSLGSLLKALQTDGETTIVTTPKLIAQDGKTSHIFIGQNIPYLGALTQITQPTSQVTTSQTFEYQDIGMDLSLTPVMGNADVVSLTIEMNNSSVLTDANGNAVSNPQTLGVTTTKTNMSTTVHIPNKNFLILSGMILDNKTKQKTGIPCLGGLPWIGAAFSETKKAENKNNIVIFIRPHIINSYKDMNKITESQEETFRDLAGTPNLERDFSEAVEQVKPVELDDELP